MDEAERGPSGSGSDNGNGKVVGMVRCVAVAVRNDDRVGRFRDSRQDIVFGKTTWRGAGKCRV